MLRQRQGQPASASAATAAEQTALEAQTETYAKSSPQSLIDIKTQQLANIGPGGWPKALAYAAACVPMWLTGALQPAWAAITRPSDVFKRPDPSAFKLVPPFPLHEEFITVNGIKLHAMSPGRQPGKPLMLMLHGFPECWYSWRHQMTAFAQGYDVVALDMRGYNTSDKPRGISSYRLDVLASDIKAAVSALGHSSCTLVAHDWGGGVAWVTAGMYGKELINKLIICGAVHFGIMATNMHVGQYLKSLYVMSFIAPWLAEKSCTMGNGSLLRMAFMGQPMGIQNSGAFTEQDLDWLRAIRRQVDMPVLVLHGESDVALGVEMHDGLEAVAPHSTVKVIKNCSHWVQQDYPGFVTKLMKEWLAAQAKQ